MVGQHQRKVLAGIGTYDCTARDELVPLLNPNRARPIDDVLDRGDEPRAHQEASSNVFSIARINLNPNHAAACATHEFCQRRRGLTQNLRNRP
jgi:hypothetical protein